MSVRPLFQKPKDVRYVDMAIAVDEEFYDENCDFNKMYTYMYLLAYMLACKKKYFTTTRDYEEFASFLAYSAFQRMSDQDKPKVKSVLNYMNSILYFRKAAFEAQRHQEIIDPEYNTSWDPFSYSEKIRDSIETSNRQIIESSVKDLINSIPSLIEKNIPLMYKLDHTAYHNLYKSCMLSMIDRFTLPTQADDRLQVKLSSPTFDEVKYYKKYSNDSIVLWHLPKGMENVVMIVLNKVNNYLVEEIKCLSSSTKVSDDELSWMMASSFTTGGSNIEANN